MSIHKTEAIVLNKRDFRETSLIVNSYTLDYGKITGILKGIRKNPEKFASNVEVFSYNEIIFYKKRTSVLHLVSQCDLKNHFGLLRQNITKVGIATLMMELLETVMPQEDKNVEVFKLTLNSLLELTATTNPEKILSIFKIKLLHLGGFKPHIDSCVSCGSKILSQARFSLKLGGLLCHACLRKDAGARNIFRGTVATMLHIENNDFEKNLNLGISPQIKEELDYILNVFINFHLEKELKSQRVLNKIKEERESRHPAVA